jgi:hypothetical protein
MSAEKVSVKQAAWLLLLTVLVSEFTCLFVIFVLTHI